MNSSNATIITDTNFKIDSGNYSNTSNSQVTTLTIQPEANFNDTVYTCVVTPNSDDGYAVDNASVINIIDVFGKCRQKYNHLNKTAY